MADKKISALTAASTPLAGTEVLPIVQGGSTVKVSVANLTAGRTVSAQGVTTSGATALGLGVNSTVDAVTIDAAKNVGLGTASPKANTGYATLTLNNASNGGVVEFTQADSTIGQVFFDGNGGTLRTSINKPISFGTNNVEAFRVDTNQNLVISTAGKGIDFSANAHATGMTKEVLDWYEEGVWTPSLGGSSTAGTYELAIASGWYTRVGRQVTVIFDIKLDAAITGGGTGFLCIAGLPFNCATTAAAIGSCALSGVGFSALAAYIVVSPRGVGSPQLILQDIYANAGSNAVDISTLAANDVLQGTLTYLA